ncbi:exosome complex exonuclease RRP44 isoform X2 [Triplophysa rosa]|uniref:exosome complex exonuclease RRP44 isoform X2 n=1 Tax=Triplophysa rosa TaxID=992332 RepID=UPI002545D695|nr:exosome complex exonuclease RRP44 isoform X2 [Triplophysa rosa]
MLKSKTFVKKTRSGGVLKIVREHYLRDDIWCGSEVCKECKDEAPVLQEDACIESTLCVYPHYLLPDTNVVLHQIDILEDPLIKNVIILQTVLQEVKHRSAPVYKRIKDVVHDKEKHFYTFTNEHHRYTFIEREQGESANDCNDRAIRVAAKWYTDHLAKATWGRPLKVVLLTNDRANKEKAEQHGLLVYKCDEYIKSLIGNPELVDRLALTSDDQVLLQGLQNINRAVHQDVVAVELFPKECWVAPLSVVLQDDGPNDEDAEEDETPNKYLQILTSKSIVRKPTGRVVGIIKRNWRPFCGMLSQSQIKEATRHLFTPADRRIPRIRIETRQAATLVGQKIMVAIDGWPKSSRYPNGHFVKSLGTAGDKDTETEVLLLEHDVPHQPFSQAVLSFLPKMPWSITEEDMKVRVDLRHLCVCSVDPPGCTDIDDALHSRELENGNIEVGVHIADVSHFIRPGNALDQEAAKRGTTVYLCGKRIDMVPELLSSNLCSLRSNVERLAFSCIWEMNHNAEVLNIRFTKSVINSKASLTYAEAQMRIDDTNINDDITKSLRCLNKLAKILKGRRTEKGALTLSSPEVRFHMDSETHDPIDLQTKELMETNSMVEEFMLLANISVAQKIYDEFSECAVLRKHPSPPPSSYDILIKAAKSRNLVILTDSAKALADSLNNATIESFPYFNTLLRILATRCMMQAVYFCSGMDSDFHHYGLASPIYTHFTSPIRRYADIIVHRLLAVAINADTTYPDLMDKHKQAALCNNLNYRHKMAQYAQRASVAFHTQLFFRNKGIINEEGFILFVRKNAIIILIPKFGLEGTVFFENKDKPSPDHSFDSEGPMLTVEKHTFHMFDKVKVTISLDASNIQHQRIRMALIEPVIPGVSVAVAESEPEAKKPKLDR